MAVATIGGTSLYFEVEGDGPPLLLLSGLGASGLAWSTALPTLRRHFRCIVYDNRGIGRSGPWTGNYTIDDLADDAVALLGHLSITRAHAVGWSLGGSVLQSMLVRHDTRVGRAVLLNAFPSYTGLQHAWLDGLLALRAAGADRVAQAAFGLPWGLSPRLLADHDRALQIASLAAKDPYPPSNAEFAMQAAALRAYDSRRDLPRVAGPVLVLAGADDILTPVAQSAEIAGLIPGATLRVLRSGGHRMIVEYPDETVAEILSFLHAQSD